MMWWRRRQHKDCTVEADAAVQRAKQARQEVDKQARDLTPVLDRLRKAKQDNQIYENVLRTLREAR